MSINSGTNKYDIVDKQTSLQVLEKLGKIIVLGKEIKERISLCAQDFKGIQEAVHAHLEEGDVYKETNFDEIYKGIKILEKETAVVVDELNILFTENSVSLITLKELESLESRMLERISAIEDMLRQRGYYGLLGAERQEFLNEKKNEERRRIESLQKELDDVMVTAELKQKEEAHTSQEQKQLTVLKQMVAEQTHTIVQQEEAIVQKDEMIAEKDQIIAQKDQEITTLNKQAGPVEKIFILDLGLIEQNREAFKAELASWKLLYKNFSDKESKESLQIMEKINDMETTVREVNVKKMSSIDKIRKERLAFEYRYEQLAAEEKAEVSVEQEEDGFADLREEASNESKFPAFVVDLKKKLASRVAITLGVIGISLSASTLQSAMQKNPIQNTPLKTDIKKVEVVKTPVKTVSIKKEADLMPEVSQKQLEKELFETVNTHPLKNASIGTYAPDGTVYTNWTVEKLIKRNPRLKSLLHMYGGATSIEPVGYFQTKDGLKKVQGQTYANGKMGITSSWGTVPVTFALEMSFNNGKVVRAGLGSMLKPLSQNFSAPAITSRKIENPHKEIQKKTQISMEYMEQSKDTNKKGIFGTFKSLASGIKDKASRFFA